MQLFDCFDYKQLKLYVSKTNIYVYIAFLICSFINLKKCQKMLSDYRNYYHFYQKYLFNQFSQQLSLYYYSCLALPTCSINSSFVHFHKKNYLLPTLFSVWQVWEKNNYIYSNWQKSIHFSECQNSQHILISHRK